MNDPTDQVPPNDSPETGDNASTPASVPGLETDPDARQWAMFAHLSALLGALLTTHWAGSLGCFIGPLIIWLAKKDDMPFVEDQAKEALNFNLTVSVVLLVLALFAFGTFGLGLIVAIPGYVVLGLYWLVMTIVASIKAHEGVTYRYPFCLRFIK